MPLPPENINADITPTDFELLVKEFLVGAAKELNSFNATHNVNIQASDGEYQIDVFAEFEYLGATFKILVECKRHKNKIKREVVQLLHSKIQTLGAQKGMIFSTSGFQEGAITYAKEHGIALIRVIEGRYTYFTKSAGEQKFAPPEWADIPKYVGEFENGQSISFLQTGYFDSLKRFLFDEN